MISVSQVMRNRVEPILASQSLEEAVTIIENSGLPGLPVVDKDHKLLGIVFKDSLQEAESKTPLGKC